LLSLREIRCPHLPFPEQFLGVFTQRILSTLRELHRVGLLQGDLSPTQILVSGGGGASLLQREGEISVATPLNRPPRHLAGTPAGDLFSLGALLYTLIEGREPYFGESEEALLSEYRSPPPAMELAATFFSPGVRRCVLHLLTAPEAAQAELQCGALVGFHSPPSSEAQDLALLEAGEAFGTLAPGAMAPGAAPLALDPKEALRLQRLAMVRGSGGAAAEEALRAARVEAHAEKKRLKAQYVVAGGGALPAGKAWDPPRDSAAALISRADPSTRWGASPPSAPTPPPSPPKKSALPPAASPRFVSKAARQAAKAVEEEASLEEARRVAFLERVNLVKKAQSMFSGQGLAALGLEAMPTTPASPAAAASAFMAAPLARPAAGGGGGEEPPSAGLGAALHSNLRAERLRKKQEEEEAVLEAARKVAFAERLMLQKKHGRQ